MAQSRKRKDGSSEIVKLIQQVEPGELLRVLEYGIREIIEAELSSHLGAQPYERSGVRTAYRNGIRSRKSPLATGLGPIEVGIPKLRQGHFYPSLLEHYRRVDRALISIISDAYINGVSTRKMNNLFAELKLDKIDRSLVSRCASRLDAEVEAWKNRALERHYAYVWLDAIYTKVRTDSKVVSTAVLIAIGLRPDGYRDVLGLHLGNRESGYIWKEFLQSLKSRGLERSELWISDDHDGLTKSIEECFPGQLRQRCLVHWMRNAMDKTAKSDVVWLLPLLKDLVSSKTVTGFGLAWESLITEVGARGKDKLQDWLEGSYHEIITYLDFPPEHWTKIKSTNPPERLNEELRRRERCVRIFPDEGSCLRLPGSILQGYSEDWISNRTYLAQPLVKIQENRSNKMTVKSKPELRLKTCFA